MYLGDFATGKTVRVKWNSADATAAPSSASSVTVKIYKDSSTTTETTTGVTHTEDLDSVTGLNEAVIDTSADGTFYSAGSEYFIIATAATINGVSVAGLLLGHFSLAARSALRPATADRTLAVDGSGQVTVGTIANGVIAAATFAANALDAVWSTATRILTAATNITSTGGTTVPQTGDSYARLGAPAGASVSADVAAVKSDLDAGVTVTTNNDKTGYGLSSAAIQAIWDALTSAFTTVGSIGKLLVDNVTASIAAVKAKTDNLPASPAATGDAMILTSAYDAAKTAAQAGDAMALTSAERNSTADALLDRTDAVETGLTPRGALRLVTAAEAGKLSGAATTTVTIRNAVADAKARITATVDSDGNRTAITTDVT